MERTDGKFLTVAGSADVHQATGVRTDDNVGASFLEITEFVSDHSSRDLGIADGEGTSETATLIEAGQWDIFQILNFP